MPLCRLAEAAVWAVARWADTYLFPDQTSPPPSLAMQQGFSGASANANQTLATLVRVATSALTQPAWAGEVDLHSVAVGKLLAALVKRRQAAARLVALPEWQQLAGKCPLACFCSSTLSPACFSKLLQMARLCTGSFNQGVENI